MRQFIAHFIRFFQSATEQRSPAAQLMQAAGQQSGLDQRYAQELRAAASAYLRVVR